MFSKYILIGVRLFMGVTMLCTGLNEFFQWVDLPLSGEAKDFMHQLRTVGSGYIMKTAGLVQIVAGLAFLFNKFVPLAAIILFPVMVNALLFHVFLDFGGAIGAVFCCLLNVVILFNNKAAYDNLLKP